MKVVERHHLERWMCLREAHRILDSFFGDPTTYPGHDFYSHTRGINKDIPEEFYPLVLLADQLPGVRGLRLSAASSSGPDGEIRFWSHPTLTVQITCAHERDDHYIIRHELRDTGRYLGQGRSTDEVIAMRLKRIVTAVAGKERNFHSGTHALLIQEESLFWSDQLETKLKSQLSEALAALPPSNYGSTYVTFDKDVARVR